MEENLPPGFRFHPTDEELITYYLCQKVSDLEFTSKAITDVDLNKCEPWDLPAKASMGEKEWYFFSLRDRKYPTGLRTNRATEAGYWKTTGKDKEIHRGGVVLVGMKKTLVFYKGRAPKGEKTNWVMHEYRLHTNHSFRPSKDEWVVCRVFQKNVAIKRPQLTSLLDQQSPDSPDETNINISNEFGDIELPNLNVFSSSSDGDFSHPDPLTNYANSDNLNPNMSNLNWLPPLSSWSSSLLSPSLNSAMNSLLVKALQFRNMTDYSTYAQQMGNNNIMPQFGANFTSTHSSNFTSSTSLPNIVSSTSNTNFDNQPTTRSEQVHDHIQQQDQQHQQEQPFNWTPFVE